MSSHKLRFIFRDISVKRLWNAWFRTQLLSSVSRRCRRDRVRDVWSCLRQTLLRPSRTLLLSVAAYNGDDDEEGTMPCSQDISDEDLERSSHTLLPSVAAYNGDDEEGTMPCSQDISDEDLEALVHDFEGVDELSRTTLFCQGCQRRLVIDKKHPGVLYCTCSGTQPPQPSEDGWVPYMEADDVIIWRKEYKPGGLFAYKVYGRYKDLMASDFAMIQVDGAYRRSWDDAVAALSIVEPNANGVRSQTVLHWEVLWPRLFANRDYVYLRRHKEFDVKSACLAHKVSKVARAPEDALCCERGNLFLPSVCHSQFFAFKEAIFSGTALQPCEPPEERPSVHSHAKLKSMELERREQRESGQRGTMEDKVNKVYVIVSRSCTHPDVPETRNAIRVQEYWSHMVVRTLDGPNSEGMEFVLTYYDEPSVGGLPAGVSAWATGRAAPSYLARMHRAATHYARWRQAHRELAPDFEPFDAELSGPSAVEHKSPRRLPVVHVTVNEQDMESSKHGPELDSGYEPRDQGTQTDTQDRPRRDVGIDPIKHGATEIIPDASKTKVIDTVKTNSDAKVTEKARTSDEGKVTEKVKASDKVKVTDEVKVTEKVESGNAEGDVKVTGEVEAENKDNVTSEGLESKEATESERKEEHTVESEGDEKKSSWWRYLYPFYYFV